MKGIPIARWEVLSPLIDELLDADAEECAARLAEIRGRDPGLAEQLAGLLAREATMDRQAFLSGSFLSAAVPIEPVSLAGTRIGAYTLESSLGAGGMGTVWLAHRSDGRFDGKVAIKFLQLALLARVGAERFWREGKLLARLAHPNIARLLDAGITESGQPYLILEYVDGQPIDRWCDARALDVRSIVLLFLDILGAVAHAHSKLVLHLDLKPSNILVTADGRVKLLDFGVAKLLEDETGSSRQTVAWFTPAYAAPEQVQGGEMTTATDVYNLGVVLYELLTRTRPRQARRPASSAAPEASIRNHERPPASSLAPGGIGRQLRGDLDAILHQALKEQPGERYPTVSAFADDLRRHLDGHPIQARPDRIAYRLAKLAVRHKLAVFACVAVCIAVFAGSTAALWQAHIASMERDRALTALDRNEATVAFVYDFIHRGTIDNLTLEKEKETLQQLLEQTEHLVEAWLGRQPEVQATFLQYLADFHEAQGRYTRASTILLRAAELVRDSRDMSLRAEIECHHALSMARSGRADVARKTIEDWLARDDLIPASAARCQLSLVSVATTLFDAPTALEQALAVQARLRAGKPWLPLLEAESSSQLGWALYLNGRNAEAQVQYLAALKIYADLDRSAIPAALAIRDNWALAVRATGNLERARSIQEETRRMALRGQHIRISPVAILDYAATLAVLGEMDAASQQVDQALRIAEETDADAERTLALIAKAALSVERGDRDQAERLIEGAARAALSVPEDARVATALGMARARAFLLQGRLQDARETVSPIVRWLGQRGMRTPLSVDALCLHARILQQQGDGDGAARSARHALGIVRALQGGRRDPIGPGLTACRTIAQQ